MMARVAVARSVVVLMCVAALPAMGQTLKPMFSLTLGGHIATGMRDFIPGCIGTPPSFARSGRQAVPSSSECPTQGPTTHRRRDSRRRTTFFDIMYRTAPANDGSEQDSSAHTWIAARQADDDTSWAELYNAFKRGTTPALDGVVVYADADGTPVLSVKLHGIAILSHTPVAVASKTNRKGASESQAVSEEIEFVVAAVQVSTQDPPAAEAGTARGVSAALDLFAGGGGKSMPFRDFGRVSGGARRMDASRVSLREVEQCSVSEKGVRSCGRHTEVSAGEEAERQMWLSVPSTGFLEDIAMIVNKNNDTHRAAWDSVLTVKDGTGKALRTVTYQGNQATCLMLPRASGVDESPVVHPMAQSTRRRSQGRRRRRRSMPWGIGYTNIEMILSNLPGEF